MPFRIEFSSEAEQQYLRLLQNDPKKARRVENTLGRLELDPKHPGLHTHDYKTLTGPNGAKVWESYVENNAPAAYRVFWYYGPDQGVITILAITPHP